MPWGTTAPALTGPFAGSDGPAAPTAVPALAGHEITPGTGPATSPGSAWQTLANWVRAGLRTPPMPSTGGPRPDQPAVRTRQSRAPMSTGPTPPERSRSRTSPVFSGGGRFCPAAGSCQRSGYPQTAWASAVPVNAAPSPATTLAAMFAAA